MLRTRFLVTPLAQGYKTRDFCDPPGGGCDALFNMTRIFITAFEPYDGWEANSSWLALVEFTKQLQPTDQITTRLYPVDFAAVKEKLQVDLAKDYDFALHLGQAPGSSAVRLEAIGLNVGGHSSQRSEEFGLLADDGPVAYRSSLPLAEWSVALRGGGIPANVSYHAGEYLCNATLYLSHYYAQRLRLRTQSAFLHFPLAYEQTVDSRQQMPAMPSEMAAQALRWIVDQLVKPEPAPQQELA